MKLIRWMGGATAAVAMMTMAVAPADAQRGHGGHYRGHHGHYRGDRIDGGGVLLGALLAGGLIALATSSSKRARDADDDGADYSPPPPPSSSSDYDHDSRPAADRDVDDREDDAANRCASAAEDKARTYAQYARVTDISDVNPASGGGYYVNGTIELSQSDSSGTSTRHGFRCSLIGSGAPYIVINGLS